MGIPVEVQGSVLVHNKTVPTGFYQVSGIGTGLLYTTGDAFGGKFEIPVPLSGEIRTAVFLDKDDEGLETDLVIFSRDFDATADNAAFAVSDGDLQNFVTTITFATFKNFANNQTSTVGSVGVAYVAPERKLYCQMVTRGGPTIAAADTIPMVSLTILADE